MKKWIIITGSIIIIISSIIVGYFIFKNSNNTTQISHNNEIKIDNIINNKTNTNDIVVTSYSGFKVTPNTKMIFKTAYNKCNHIETNEEKASEDVVNLNEQELKEKYKDFIIKKFGTEEVVLYRVLDEYCDNHYILKEKDGVVAIYKLDKLGNEKLHEITGISIQYLPETDKISIQNGIEIYGENKLNKILEDFE